MCSDYNSSIWQRLQELHPSSVLGKFEAQNAASVDCIYVFSDTASFLFSLQGFNSQRYGCSTTSVMWIAAFDFWESDEIRHSDLLPYFILLHYLKYSH